MERGSVREPGCAMNHKVKKTIRLVLIPVLLLLYLAGCSTVKNMIGWVNPWNSDKTKAGLTDKDVTQFVSNVRSNGGNPNSHYLLACYYQEKSRHKEALEEFKKVLLIDPNYVKAYNGMGVSYDLLGDFSRAIEYYNDALKLDPNLGYVYNNLGYSYLLQGNLDDAMTALKRAIVINVQDQRFHNNLGLAYGEKGQYDTALAEFKLAGDEAKAHHNLTQIYFKKGLVDEAKNQYAMALKIDPSLTVVRTGLRAADSLARIFEPIPNKADPEQLVTPDQPSVRIAEMEKLVAPDQSTTVEPKLEEKIFPEQSTNKNTKREKSVTPKQFTVRKTEMEELATPVRLASLKAEEVPASTYYEFPEELIIYEKHPDKKGLNSLKDVEVEISNGNGVYRMAKGVGDYLKEKGLKVTRLTNANHFRHTETRIFYQREYEAAADHVAEQLPVIGNKEQKGKFDRPTIKVKILIGKDLIPHLRTFENGAKS